MDYVNPEALVDTDWLAANLGSPGLAIVDATWFPKQSPRDARAEFETAHMPGAVYFDIDDIAEKDTDLPHMLPDAGTFAAKVGALGIGDADRVIAYDSNGGAAAAARAWWMFRVFGHDNVSVLSGGFKKWQAEGRPIEAGVPTPAAKPFSIRTPGGGRRDHLVRSLDQILANIDTRESQVVDARNAARFAGTAKEPWPVIKLGHIPGSLNLPFADLMDGDDFGTIRPAEKIAAALRNAGIDPEKPVVTSCGSGVTAAIVSLGLYLIGHKDAAIYDGSWSDWGKREHTPVET